MYVKTIDCIAECRDSDDSALQDVHWTRVFTDRINNSTKLVGPTISCEGGSWMPAAVLACRTGKPSQGAITVHVMQRTRNQRLGLCAAGIQPVGFPKERKNPHVQSFVVATDQVSPLRCRASFRF